MLRGRRSLVRLGALLGPDVRAARQSLVALAVSLLASLVAGLTLGSIQSTLERLPGLLVLVPAAIGMRGTIFGALGSRLGTAIHTGTFGLARRTDTVVGQNVLASVALSLSTSVGLAVMAKAAMVAFGLEQSISITDLLVISVIGGAMSSVVVLLCTVALAGGSVRAGWDTDNVLAPLITAAGDMVTLPALFVATAFADRGAVTSLLAAVLAVLAMIPLVLGLRSSRDVLRRIVQESLPVVLLAGLVDLAAGVTMEKRLDEFGEFPALLVLVPPFLAGAGALGGILSSRLSSALHLGVVEATTVPGRRARADIWQAVALAVPLFVLTSLVADAGSFAADLASPGPATMLAVSLLGGLVVTVFVLFVSYYGTIAAFRVGMDPDTYGIPVVTASVDFAGAFALVLAIAALGVA